MSKVSTLLQHHRFRLLLILFCFLAIDLGLVITIIERNDQGANIRSVEDGIWWAVTTMTGIGYGDVYPVTSLGRIVGMTLEVIGVVVFGLIVGYIAVEIFSAKDKFYWARLEKRLDHFDQRLNVIEKMLSYQVKKGQPAKKK